VVLGIPYSKKCYVIVETPQNPYNTEDPVSVRETLQSWDVDGAFLSYNQGFGERDRFYEYYSALEDYIENLGFIVNTFGRYFSDYTTTACTTGEDISGWINPYLIYKNGINFDSQYKNMLDNLIEYLNRYPLGEGMVLFDHVRYPQGNSYCPNCSVQTWQNRIYNITQATSIVKSYISNNANISTQSFGGVLHPQRNPTNNTCCQAWNVGQAYDDTKGITRYLGFVAVMLYTILREDYIQWMFNLAKNGDSYSGYSTTGTNKELLILLSTYPTTYNYYDDLQIVINDALNYFEGVVFWEYQSLKNNFGGIERY